MKTSKKQFDDLFKQKLSSIKFEPNAAAQEALLKQIKKNKTKLVKKTWGKLSFVLLMVSTFVMLQQKVQYGSNPNLFQSQASVPLLAVFPTFEWGKPSAPNAALEVPTPQNPILSVVANLQANEQAKQPEIWDPLKIEKHNARKVLQPRTEQLAPPITDFFEFEGQPLFESKASTNQTLLCGQNQAQTKLIIAQSKIAKFATDSIVRNQENGICRPSGFDENAIIQYAIYDKRSLFRRFQAENIHWGLVRTTKIAKPVKEVQETKPTTKAEKTRTNKTTRYASSLYDPHIHLHSTRQYIEPEYEEYNYNIKNDSIIFISDRVNFVVVMEPNGTILSKAQIEITEPFVYYLGEKRALFDAVTGKVYICVATLYHFNFYELEPANGKTNFVMQLNDVWPDPHFQIENGKLSYVKNNIGHQQML
jgi:hypothetical protein